MSHPYSLDNCFFASRFYGAWIRLPLQTGAWLRISRVGSSIQTIAIVGARFDSGTFFSGEMRERQRAPPEDASIRRSSLGWLMT